MNERVSKALEELKKGNFVLVHDFDSREDETDMVVAAEYVTPEHVAEMRCSAGGLICVAVDGVFAEKIGLPFMVDVYKEAEKRFPLLSKVTVDQTGYDYRSAFSLTVNHRKTYTGIPDGERALTISSLGRLCGRPNGELQEAFAAEFRSPGHVHLLISSDLTNREGHTELSTALLKMAGLCPVATVCEMLDSTTHKALSKTEAVKYAKKHNLIFLSGEEVKEAYEDWGR